jgi:hypothetical protein
VACSRGRGDGVLEASIALASPPGSSGVPAGDAMRDAVAATRRGHRGTPSPRRRDKIPSK